jgi:hypothetical protein
MLTKTLGPQKDEVTGGCYGQKVHAAYMVYEVRNAHTILTGKHKGKRIHERQDKNGS